MNQFTIIEDCSPYYIRFTHPGIEDVIEYCKQCSPDTSDLQRFRHHILPPDQVSEVVTKTPMSKLMPLYTTRVSLFLTSPGMYYQAHKDGTNHRFSINYTVSILDDKCVTSWYSDDDLKDYEIDTLGNRSRECRGFDKTKHTPLKSMTAKPGECILFNTDIFHDWDNTQSSNVRIVLTLRIKQPLTGTTYFEDAKKLIFDQ